MVRTSSATPSSGFIVEVLDIHTRNYPTLLKLKGVVAMASNMPTLSKDSGDVVNGCMKKCNTPDIEMLTIALCIVESAA